MKRKATTTTKVINFSFWVLLGISILFCASVLLPEFHKTQKIRAGLEQLKQEKNEREYQITCLRRDIKNMELPEYIKKAAREELGFVQPGETKYIFE